MSAETSSLYRELPSVDEVLRSLAPRNGASPAALRNAVRAVLDSIRSEIAAGTMDEPGLRERLDELPSAIDKASHAQRSLRAVINASGVILHTNLGRAPLPAAAIQHIAETAARYSNLEFDLSNGERGKRDVHAQSLLAGVLGVDTSSIVVNNCAAATLLALNALAERADVIVSRGELVEIGGSFRVPDIMSKSGARLVEVGTTNRTSLADYERAITPATRLIMRVSRSNFEMVGFTQQPTLSELVTVGVKHGIPVFEDHGNGCLVDLHLAPVHSVQQSLASGCDLVAFSGDKLLGGPQCGILSGKPEIIARLRSNPLFRALRVDKLTYAALEATLIAYCDEDYDAVPALRMLRLSGDEIRERAEHLASSLRAHYDVEVAAGESVVGGGTPPSATLPTYLLTLRHTAKNPRQLHSALRDSLPPVIARIQDDRLVLDLRTVFPDEDSTLLAALQAIA